MSDPYDQYPDEDIPILEQGIREVTSYFNEQTGEFRIDWNNNLTLNWVNPRTLAITMDIMKRWSEEPDE